VGAAIMILIVHTWWPELLPWHVFGVWTSRGTVSEWCKSVWPIFAWGGTLAFLGAFWHYATRGNYNRIFDAEDSVGSMFVQGTIVSVLAGIFEEIYFRWIAFYGVIGGLVFGNFLFFKWAGFGIAEWFHMHAWGPLANWTTGEHLHGYLFHPAGWQVGAAMLTANAFFRDGHKYQGILGVINSWFIGMALFWVMFTYGLPAAIFVHFAYDMLVLALVRPLVKTLFA